jgi:hypothetical protein
VLKKLLTAGNAGYAEKKINLNSAVSAIPAVNYITHPGRAYPAEIAALSLLAPLE